MGVLLRWRLLGHRDVAPLMAEADGVGARVDKRGAPWHTVKPSTGIWSYASMIDMYTVTVSPKFQVVIPLDVRRRMKLEAGMKLMVIELNGGLRLLPVQPPSALRGIARGIDPDVARVPDRQI